MFSDNLIGLAVVGLAALSVGMIVYVLAMPYFSGERQAGKRRESISRRQSHRKTRGAGGEEEIGHRRKQVQETLKDLEAKQKAKKSINMRTRLMRAGLQLSPQKFYLFSAISALTFALAALLGGLIPLVAVALAFVGGLGLPRWILNYLTKRRQKKFLGEFANAIDVVVRGVKSGLPLGECLEIIARESPEPIRTEFAELVEQNRVGVPLAEGFERMMERMPVSEVNFFAIVVSIQQQAGGSLSEALGNLSGVLRARTQLAAKVRAMSAEAKASAMILGALPFTVMTMVYVTSPDYISLLWLDRTGHMMLAGAGLWMSCGLLVMKKMINFDY